MKKVDDVDQQKHLRHRQKSCIFHLVARESLKSELGERIRENVKQAAGKNLPIQIDSKQKNCRRPRGTSVITKLSFYCLLRIVHLDELFHRVACFFIFFPVLPPIKRNNATYAMLPRINLSQWIQFLHSVMKPGFGFRVSWTSGCRCLIVLFQLFFFLLYFDENSSMFILKEKIGSFQGGLASLLNEGKVV